MIPFNRHFLPANPFPTREISTGQPIQGIYRTQLEYNETEGIKLYTKPGNFGFFGAGGAVERVKGIEPSQPAWKAGALPLSYTRTRRTRSYSTRAENQVSYTPMSDKIGARRSALVYLPSFAASEIRLGRAPRWLFFADGFFSA